MGLGRGVCNKAMLNRSGMSRNRGSRSGLSDLEYERMVDPATVELRELVEENRRLARLVADLLAKLETTK